ncbi:MAG: pyrroline-5-carboxylate reductase [Lachnospiraceae bacterium]|nr:pyrroline-5-carboxylate reductase [Lachnospiraceae bacterium]
MKTVGFIGCGNMGSAIMGGILKKGYTDAAHVIAADKSAAQLKKAEEAFGIRTTQENLEAVKESDIIFLSVKPQFYETVIQEIRDCVDEKKLVITIAPGWSLERLAASFGRKVQIVRTMPNTPALVGEGNIVVTPGTFVSEENLEEALFILRCCGKATLIPENLMDAAVAVSGSSPAYVFMMIEAMADAAVIDGMPRAQAYQFAAQAVYGSAKMVLETGKHPGELKDMVCSPAGTTIEAVRVLEEKGFRSSIIEAMQSCTRKTKGM